MGLTTLEATREEVSALLPRGPIWNGKAPVLGALVGQLAQVAYDASMGLDEMLVELDPSTTTLLLPEWERMAGLPDPCFPAVTLQERRSVLVARLAWIGGASRRFFIDLAESLGYAIWIEEIDPAVWRIGASAMGDPREGEDAGYRWIVHAPEESIQHFRVGQSSMGDPLRSWGNELLECAIRALKPAHTEVTFAYDSVAPSMAVPGGSLVLDGENRMPVPGGHVQTDGQDLEVPGGVVELT